jgi:hypothetical protein
MIFPTVAVVVGTLLALGDAAESYKSVCTNDAASLVNSLVNSLGAKTVLAIVVGAVAFLAF